MITYIKDRNNLWTVLINSKPYQFNPSNKNYDELVECVKNADEQRIVDILDKKETLNAWGEGCFSMKDGVIFYRGDQVHEIISDRIIEMIDSGFDYMPMLNFVERLYKNSSCRAIDELYTFLSHKSLPISTDGHFLAYKAVSVMNHDGEMIDLNGNILRKGDFVDKHTGKSFRNNVGDSPSMHRYKVNDNCNEGCSSGLHVGSIEYVKSYASSGDKIVICKVDPANVVSVPLDSNHQKVRVCRYEVVGIYEITFEDPVVRDYDEYEWDNEELENEDDDEYGWSEDEE